MSVIGHEEEDKEKQKKEKQKHEVCKEKRGCRRKACACVVLELCCSRNCFTGPLTSSTASSSFSCPRERQSVFLSRLQKIKSSNFCQCLLLPNAATHPCFKETPNLFWMYTGHEIWQVKVTTDVSPEECNPTLQLRESASPCPGLTLFAF